MKGRALMIVSAQRREQGLDDEVLESLTSKINLIAWDNMGLYLPVYPLTGTPRVNDGTTPGEHTIAVIPRTNGTITSQAANPARITST
jgi:hypothetical protein